MRNAPDGFQVVDVPVDECEAPVSKFCVSCGCKLNYSSASLYCWGCSMKVARHERACVRPSCDRRFIPDNNRQTMCSPCREEWDRLRLLCACCGGEFLEYGCRICAAEHKKTKTKALRLNVVCPTCHYKNLHSDVDARERPCRMCGCSFIRKVCSVESCGKELLDMCDMCHEETSTIHAAAVILEGRDD
jgi:hypothetical protein